MLIQVSRYVSIIFFLLILLIIPKFLSDYWLHVAILGYFFALLSSSWSLLGGYAGQFSFGHMAFAGLGAYGSALIVKYYSLPLILSITIAIAIAMLIAGLIGILCLRLKGAYLALFTIAFSEILRRVLHAEDKITQGARGLEVQPLINAADVSMYYYIILTLLILSILIMYFIVNSRWGLYFKAIREDEVAASALGVNVVRYKIMAFFITGGFASLAGTIFAHYTQLLTPDFVSIPKMGLVIIMAILGGVENILAAAIGAVIIQFGLEYLRIIGPWRFVMFGALLMITLKYTPDGLISPILNKLNFLKQSKLERLEE